MKRLCFSVFTAFLLIMVKGCADTSPADFQIVSASWRGRCFDVLFEGIDSEITINSVHAAEALTMMRQNDFVRYRLTERLGLEKDTKMKCCIARELVRAGYKEYGEILFNTLKDPDSSAYAHAAEGIHKADIDADVSILKNAFKFTNLPLDRLWLNAAIFKISGEGLPKLKRMLYGDDLLIASVAALVLGESGKLANEDVNCLKSDIERFSPVQRAILYSGLWSYAGDESEKALLGLTASPEPSVRAFAAYSLRKSQSNESVCALLRLMDQDDNEDVRIRSAHALLHIISPGRTLISTSSISRRNN
jgi:HEAT repeat protein